MLNHDSSLIDTIKTHFSLDATILDNYLQHSQKSSHFELLPTLVKQDIVSEEELLAFLSDRYHLPLFSSISGIPTPFEKADLAISIYQQTKVLVLQLEDTILALMSLSSNWNTLSLIPSFLSAPVEWYWSTQHQILHFLDFESNQKVLSDLSATDQLQHILETAIQKRASDVHFESEEKIGKIRYRIDGKLHLSMTLQKKDFISTISRLKILSGLDIAVKRRPQDGHYSWRTQEGSMYDLRVSSIPITQGEKVVIRILDQTPIQYRLDTLGFLQEDLFLLQQICQKTSGMILVVGPTGSGKTTTLYSMLNEVDYVSKNIVTIEDPVEYHLTGISQVSVNPEQSLSFVQALRAFLRQDPDIILVGEIRDEETAQVAVRAALTGHLVLTTLHSLSVTTTLQRLHNLGIETNLLADTLQLILSQRLVRKRCSCNFSSSCPQCNGSGFYGRIPVYEILYVSTTIRERIQQNYFGSELLSPATDLHYRSLEETGNQLLKQNLTTASELNVLHAQS